MKGFGHPSIFFHLAFGPRGSTVSGRQRNWTVISSLCCGICSKCYEHAAPYPPASIAWTIIRNTLLILAVFLGAFMGTTFAYSVIVSFVPRLFD